MPLIPVVEDINQVDENLRGHYKQTDQGFVLDVQPTNGYSLENVAALKSALGKERATAQELSRKIGAFASLGDLDPSDISQRLEELEKLKQLDPNKEADKLAEAKFKSVQEQMTSKFTKELTSSKTEAEKYKNELKKLKVDDAARQAIIAAGGDDTTAMIMMPHVKARLSLQETENGFMTQVLDLNGHPAIADTAGTPMSVQQLVEEMRSEPSWAKVFPGRNRSGGGRPSDSNGGTPNLSKVNLATMSRQEKMALEKQIGSDEYRKLILKG